MPTGVSIADLAAGWWVTACGLTHPTGSTSPAPA